MTELSGVVERGIESADAFGIPPTVQSATWTEMPRFCAGDEGTWAGVGTSLDRIAKDLQAIAVADNNKAAIEAIVSRVRRERDALIDCVGRTFHAAMQREYNPQIRGFGPVLGHATQATPAGSRKATTVKTEPPDVVVAKAPASRPTVDSVLSEEVQLRKVDEK